MKSSQCCLSAKAWNLDETTKTSLKRRRDNLDVFGRLNDELIYLEKATHYGLLEKCNKAAVQMITFINIAFFNVIFNVACTQVITSTQK